MDFLAEYMATILAAITSFTGMLIAITSFVKSLKSEGRVKNELKATMETVKNEMDAAMNAVKITREGIVQGFKEAVVTKDVKVSINKEVKRILDDRLDVFYKEIVKSEERRTKMMYWVLKILDWTAASGKLTNEQRSEIEELLALIAEEEQIVDTTIE